MTNDKTIEYLDLLHTDLYALFDRVTYKDEREYKMYLSAQIAALEHAVYVFEKYL